jgi:ubiquinone/menaquinone biosynthesis C-methylase UbiE
MTAAELKESVRRFWDARPCGSAEVTEAAPGTPAFFDALDARRYRLEPFIERYARFAEQRGRRVLEVGCGAGSDLFRFARAGARVTGVDLSARSLRLARQRLALTGLRARLLVADAEALPLRDASFDFVYSWGVLHHTPDTARAAAEACRVLTRGGRACVMLYHRRSLFVLQAWLYYALLRGRPGRSPAGVLAAHLESPGTKAYSAREAATLFKVAGFAEVTVQSIATAWDVRLGRRRFLPAWCRGVFPAGLGWYLVVEAHR